MPMHCFTGAEKIADERKRQIEGEGFGSEHDQEHDESELAWAAVCYAAPRPVFDKHEGMEAIRFEDPWAWDQGWDKRHRDEQTQKLLPFEAVYHGEKTVSVTDRIRDLEKAGALIAAEIDRLMALSPRLKKGG